MQGLCFLNDSPHSCYTYVRDNASLKVATLAVAVHSKRGGIKKHTPNNRLSVLLYIK